MEKALGRITTGDLKEHIRTISSDEFEGRAPASKGEELTLDYIRKEFEKRGLRPGNGDSFFQEVPMVSITTVTDGDLRIEGGRKSLSFSYGGECMVSTRRVREKRR